MDKIVVKSRDTVGEYVKRLGQDFVVISMTNPGWDFAELPENEHCRGVLRLRFHDITTALAGYVHFTEAHAREIWRFVEDNPSSLVVCQCDYGISRSSGVAAALAHAHGLDVEWYFNHPVYSPNMLVFELLLRTHRVDGS